MKVVVTGAAGMVGSNLVHGLNAIGVDDVIAVDDLTDGQIEAYLRVEQPYDCAGSAKSEGLGIALMETLSGDDPTALIGLPLIALTRMLRAEGVDPLLMARPLPGAGAM